MRNETVSERYEAMMDAINAYVDAEKEATADFHDSQCELPDEDVMQLDGGVIYLGYGGDELVAPHPLCQSIDVPKYPDPRENVTLHHDYPTLGLSCVLTGDLLNASDHDIGTILGNLVAAFMELADG